MEVKKIALDQIEQNENSRVVYKKTDLYELMGSLKRDGLLQPVGVRSLGGGKYEAIFGNRRIQAAIKLGWAEIDAHVMDEVSGDNDLEILSLIENLKRVNTSVGEDGRMFLLLKDRGMSIHEIATRLDISVIRVETAIEVCDHVDADIRPHIVNRVSGIKKPNTISATAANTILNLRKMHSLNREQTRTLLKYAQKDDTTIAHVQKVAPLMGLGHTIESAIERSESLDRICINVFVPKKKRAKLEKKYGKTIGRILSGFLIQQREFGLEAADYKKPSFRKAQHEFAARDREAQTEE